MLQLRGTAVSPGYANGKAFVVSQNTASMDVPSYEIREADVESEHRRLDQAVDRSFVELKQIETRVLAELGETHSAIFAAHLGLLRDRNFGDRIKERVRRDLINVESALQAEVGDLCKMFASADSAYIRERAQDVRDVGMRVTRQLVVSEGRYVDLPPDSVIVANELLPSETLGLDRDNVVGIVTEEGGENSHAAILARALGIPSVTGIAKATAHIPIAADVLVDGEHGVIVVTPNDARLADFGTLKSSYDRVTSAAVAAEGLDCVTEDGTRISLLANINRPLETNLVAAHHLDGVGLFRTEFMYLDSKEPPDCDQQVDVYRQSFSSLGDKPVVIRTLDLGGDKLPAFLAPHYESNPNLGSRGLRFSLSEQSLFESQIRAILMASEGRQNTRMLLPMVLGAGDLEAAVSLIHDVSSQAGVTHSMKVGAMIETPAALFALDEILEVADFLCIGTNDLTQYMLAADRNASELADDYSVLHPSVLRAISSVVAAGRAAGREVSVCGEAASYPRTACLLIGMGVRQLSMSPLRAARVRYCLREFGLPQLEHLAQEALARKSAAEVRQLLDQLTAGRDPSGGRPLASTTGRTSTCAYSQ